MCVFLFVYVGTCICMAACVCLFINMGVCARMYIYVCLASKLIFLLSPREQKRRQENEQTGCFDCKAWWPTKQINQGSKIGF